MNKKLALIILDGWGLRKSSHANPVKKASFFWSLWKKYPHTTLGAHNGYVGLPKRSLGGSEVGHLHIGAGRLVKQEMLLINEEIKTGSFFKNKELLRAIEHAKRNKSQLHIMGLFSDASIHSHINHLIALLKLCHRKKIEPVLHLFGDGRDTPPKAFKKYLRVILTQTKKYGGHIQSIIGRYYAMDRDNRWDRTRKAYEMLVHGKGKRFDDYFEAIDYQYRKGITDEFLEPLVFGDAFVRDNDAVIFFNFRADRAKQISRSFIEKRFNKFKRKKIKNLYFVSFTDYEVGTRVAFHRREIKNTLGDVLASHGFKQLRIAETEKFAHVTYFFDGGEYRKMKGKREIIIPSPKVATYDKKPEMSAFKITSKLLPIIKKGTYDVIILNFANGDMVGHTGILQAAVKAVKAVDKCLKKLVPVLKENGYDIIVTADHGNVEKMKERGKPHTAHTFNRVPFILVTKKKYKLSRSKKNSLYNIAPTVLQLLKIKKPKIMSKSLIVNKNQT